MIQRLKYAALISMFVVASSACTRHQDTGARNISVPADAQRTEHDRDRGESGMTGATHANDDNDDSQQHSEKRKAVNQGEDKEHATSESPRH